MKVVVEAFDKESELLVFEIEIEKSHLEKIKQIAGLTEDDMNFLLSGAGGFDLSADQVKEIEIATSTAIYRLDCDFQLGTSVE
ncbi:DUF7683 domain-containing protein [Photobacterium halotolerans]|uniref:DUF7683 domain-containing protein n=1 Tax=Photobacterium halotolerans TaxID=265726 RepID=UPI001373341E|nr:hypothetical protein [Photobacterium halotolerans]NAW86549.1 hypothetical protein [Photobacterium halotolerans]